jgi:hypothetical protein
VKRVVSVSLGSSTRNKTVEADFLGEHVIIQRLGADGDVQKAIAMIKELDGTVDVFGMGGIDLALHARHKSYPLKAALPMRDAAVKTPMVDGGGLKPILERRLIQYLDSSKTYDFRGKHALVVSALGHYALCDALVERGCDLAIGDAAFGLGLPFMIRTLPGLDALASVIAPIAARLPFEMLYPTGEKQTQNTPKFENWYRWADIITGDFHFIMHYMPLDMKGKTIITNTVTDNDVQEMKKRGVGLLATFTPDMDGRSFGVNVMESLLVALSGRPKSELSDKDYEDLLDRIGTSSRVEWLNK